jgi:hypothetical protein
LSKHEGEAKLPMSDGNRRLPAAAKPFTRFRRHRDISTASAGSFSSSSGPAAARKCSLGAEEDGSNAGNRKKSTGRSGSTAGQTGWRNRPPTRGTISMKMRRNARSMVFAAMRRACSRRSPQRLPRVE